jgi:hypothetical protein
MLLAAFIAKGSFLEAYGFGLDRYIEHPLALDQHGFGATRPCHGMGWSCSRNNWSAGQPGTTASGRHGFC